MRALRSRSAAVERLDANADAPRKRSGGDAGRDFACRGHRVRVLFRRRANAVAVLEIDAVVLDRFAQQLLAHPRVARVAASTPGPKPKRGAERRGVGRVRRRATSSASDRNRSTTPARNRCAPPNTVWTGCRTSVMRRARSRAPRDRGSRNVIVARRARFKPFGAAGVSKPCRPAVGCTARPFSPDSHRPCPTSSAPASRSPPSALAAHVGRRRRPSAARCRARPSRSTTSPATCRSSRAPAATWSSRSPRGGHDAKKLSIDVGELRGRNTLRVRYPDDDIVYPRTRARVELRFPHRQRRHVGRRRSRRSRLGRTSRAHQGQRPRHRGVGRPQDPRSRRQGRRRVRRRRRARRHARQRGPHG